MNAIQKIAIFCVMLSVGSGWLFGVTGDNPVSQMEKVSPGQLPPPDEDEEIAEG